jgi:hypothetical protein
MSWYNSIICFVLGYGQSTIYKLISIIDSNLFDLSPAFFTFYNGIKKGELTIIYQAHLSRVYPSCGIKYFFNQFFIRCFDIYFIIFCLAPIFQLTPGSPMKFRIFHSIVYCRRNSTLHGHLLTPTVASWFQLPSEEHTVSIWL